MRGQKKLVIAAEVDPTLLDRAREDPRFEVILRPSRTEQELSAAAGDAQILVTRAFQRVTRRVLENAPHLRLIAQGSSGTDNIDEAAARERGVVILSLPGENANAVAEMVIGYLLALTRNIPYYTREVADGRWPREDCASRHEMSFYHLGIIGLGEVGRRVAKLARAFGMRVSAYDPYLSAEDFAVRYAQPLPTLEALLESCSLVSLHVPLTAETRRMIGAAQIARMPVGSILINAARGEVMDQKAALNALSNGHLGGLALDVFDQEPPGAPLPSDPRLILTPHVAGCTHECRSAIGAKLYARIVEHYEQYLAE